MGYQGVILAYGKETVLERGEKVDIAATRNDDDAGRQQDNEKEAERTDVQAWKEGTLETVSMTSVGDFVALKFSGAGRDTMRQLAALASPSKEIEEATTEICELARRRGVRLLFDAEQDAVQGGIDAWTLLFQRRYNKGGKAVVYGTYQAYLQSAPETVARHLAVAEKEGFVLGVKLVRGAYMGSDSRELFWDTKEQTDRAYDGIAEALIRRTWSRVLRPNDSGIAFPDVALVLASHNQESVRKAMALRAEQIRTGERKIDMSYGQLMGMADEVSCDLVMTCKKNRSLLRFQDGVGDAGPKTYKYLVWGSVGECLKYLVRRAEENRDAVMRAKGSRLALKAELARRILG
ncbi:MAG: hypothetical protein Q9164_006722 [Protoblastenia rupestris]